MFDIVFPDADKGKVNALWKEQLKEPRKQRRARKMKEVEEEDDDEDDD